LTCDDAPCPPRDLDNKDRIRKNRLRVYKPSCHSDYAYTPVPPQPMPTTSITDSPVSAQPCPVGLQLEQSSLPTPLTATMSSSHVPETIVSKEFYAPPLYGHSLASATAAAPPMATAAACYGQCCDYGRVCVSAYTSPVNSFPYYPLSFSVSSEGQRLQQRHAPVYPLYPTPQEPSTVHLNAQERENLAFAKATAEVNAVNASSSSPLHDTSPGVPSMPFANAGPSGVCQMLYSSPGDSACTGTDSVNGYGYGYAHGYGHGYGYGYGYNYNYGCSYGGPNNNAGYVGI